MMSKKISHSFDPYLAEKYGVSESIFLSDVFFWVEHNKNENKNFRDGRYWTYNSANGIVKRHPYWSRSQVERIVKKLSNCGAILVAKYNADKRDRTNWYTLGDELYEYFFGDDTNNCNQEECELHSSETRNESSENAEALPNNYKDSIHNIPPISPKGGNRKTKSILIPKQEETGFSDDMQSTFVDWLLYKTKERKQPYKEIGLRNLISTTKKNLALYGEAIVIDVISRSISAGYTGIVWDWCKKMKEEQDKQEKLRREAESKLPF